MWGPIISGFTILGVFLTLSAWINGRSIKRYIGELIKEESKTSREFLERLITEESKASRELLEKLITKLSEQHEEMIKILVEIARSAR